MKRSSSIARTSSIFKNTKPVSMNEITLTNTEYLPIDSAERKILFGNAESSLWIPDEQANKCFGCSKLFNKIKIRKHHCRRCMLIFCDRLSARRIKDKRICDLCYHDLKFKLKIIK